MKQKPYIEVNMCLQRITESLVVQDILFWQIRVFSDQNSLSAVPQTWARSSTDPLEAAVLLSYKSNRDIFLGFLSSVLKLHHLF